jgi:putative multiple sugar transport system permease protein
MQIEPPYFFLVKNLVFVSMIAALSYLLSSYKGLPNVLIVMLLLMLAYDFATTRTVLGRRIYALGGNEKAARLSGIATERLTFLTFVNMGVLSALAGLIFAARLNTATPKAGLGFELDVIAACFIGGASASGGVRHLLPVRAVRRVARLAPRAFHADERRAHLLHAGTVRGRVHGGE